MSIQFTIFSSPQLLTKRIDLVEGKLVKTIPSSFVNRAERVTRPDLSSVMAVLDTLGDHMAAGWGIHSAVSDVVPVDTDKRVRAGQAVDGAIARTKKYLSWANSAGVLMFDFDCEHTPETARDALCKAWRAVFSNDEMEAAEMFYRPSSSAGCHAEGVPPLAGGRAYVACERAEDIPSIGQALFKGMWLTGQGRIDISKAGSALVRSMIDDAVWTPERIDFVAPAILGDGVSRTTVETQRWGEPGRMLAALSADVSPTVDAEFVRLRDDAKGARADVVAAARARWVDTKTVTYRAEMEAHGMTPDEVAKAVESITRSLTGAVENSTLDNRFIIYLNADMTKHVTVMDILKDPAKFNNLPCCDPLEPEGTFGKAKIYTNSAPVISSFIHGGARYRLASLSRLTVPYHPDNMRAAYVRATVAKLKEAFPGVIYRKGNAPVYVTGSGSLSMLSSNQMVLLSSDALDYEFPSSKKKGEMVLEAMPARIATHICESTQDSTFVTFPPVTQVVRAPFLIPSTGEVVDGYGYHAASQTYHHPDGQFPPLTVVRTKDDALRLARRLVGPYVDFQFHDANDEPNHAKAKALTLVLSSALRPTVVCPVYLFPASRAGCGKTYLMRCVVAEMGHRAEFTAWSPDAAEAEKRMAVHGVSGRPYLAIDNFDRPIGGDTIEALTDKPVNECLGIRILGSTVEVPVFNNALVMASGINVRPSGEAMARRCLSLLLEPGDDGAAWASRAMKLPYAPAEYILANWRERHMLALSLALWGLSADARVAPLAKPFNALPDFDRIIRRLVNELYGVDVCRDLFDDVEEVATHADTASPKGRLFYYAWEMQRAARGAGRQHWEYITDGRFPYMRCSDEELAAEAKAKEKPLPIPFTIKALKGFIEFNGLDPDGSLDVLYRSMKLLGGAGQFNGMCFVDTKVRCSVSKTVVWSFKGRPVMLPATVPTRGFGGIWTNGGKAGGNGYLKESR